MSNKVHQPDADGFLGATVNWRGTPDMWFQGRNGYVKSNGLYFHYKAGNDTVHIQGITSRNRVSPAMRVEVPADKQVLQELIAVLQSIEKMTP